jgi:hypothetical protein
VSNVLIVSSNKSFEIVEMPFKGRRDVKFDISSSPLF